MRTYFRNLADRHRNERSDRHLAFCLTFVAGAANAGGFMAVHQYTSHMSGVISSLADNLVLGDLTPVCLGLAALVFFLSGAATSAILINWARRRDLHSQYALPLALEALLLALFGFTGLIPELSAVPSVSLVIALLCFVMGLQNAMITKLSGARIRTTHVTGLVTDIGIELGKLLYWNGAYSVTTGLPPVIADRAKLWLLSRLVGLFFLGGLFGAVAFSHLGIAAALLLAGPLMGIAAFPLMADARAPRLR